MAVNDMLERMRGGLVVSVQAAPGSPLAATEHLAAIARAVEAGGAVGIRTQGIETIRAIREAVDVPVIGLVKRDTPGTDVYITPEIADVVAVAEAGADLVAVDATERPRADGRSGPKFVAAAAAELPGRIVADVDDAGAGRAAAEAGAAAVATTLSGYTSADTPGGPDIPLVAELSQTIVVPVFAEGRYSTREEVWAALGAGACAVVVGTAITNPEALTRRLATPPPLGADG